MRVWRFEWRFSWQTRRDAAIPSLFPTRVLTGARTFPTTKPHTHLCDIESTYPLDHCHLFSLEQCHRI